MVRTDRVALRCACVMGLLAAVIMPALMACAQTDDGDLPPLDEKGKIQWDVPRADPATASTAPVTSVLGDIVYFPGKPMRCRDALAGTLKACDKVFKGEQKKWWEIYKSNTRRGAAQAAACQAGDERAHYDGNATYKTLQKPMFSDREIIDGGGDAVPCDSDNLVIKTQKEFMAYERSERKPVLGWIYNDEEFDLAVQRGTGECVYVGTKCASGALGFCAIEKQVYCCFNSPVSSALRANLGDLGTADDPRCGGIPLSVALQAKVDENMVREIDARMSVSEYVPEFRDGHNMDAELFGSGSAIGNKNRKTLRERTFKRVNEENDMAAAGRALDAEFDKVLPTDARDDPTGPGRISLSAGRTTNVCGSITTINVTRSWGSQGQVSVTLEMVGLPNTNWDHIPPTTVSWSDGEEGTKRVPFHVYSLPAGGYPLDFTISNPTGGAVIYPQSRITMRLTGTCD